MIINQNHFFMKKLLFILIALMSVSTVIYASFPVTQDNTVLIDPNNQPIEASPKDGGSPSFGILSFVFSLLAIVLFVAAIELELSALLLGSLILSILSVVFGGVGFNKRLKGLAITGFILGIIELIFLFLAIVVLYAWGKGL